MKRIAFYLGLVAATVASCSVQEKDFQTSQQDDVVFYASFEQPSEGTRVYANEDLYLRWTADDRVSIFNKFTYNQQYKFLGETGDNAGGFNRVDNAEFVTGNPISHVISVYPYQAATKITEDETLSVTLPSEQHYAENTFGLGANTMVSVSADNFLQYKTVGGFLRVSLYGDGVTVSSITLKGNNGEKLAGKASVSMPLDGVPSLVMSSDATEVITLICDSPVTLGATAEESTDFWFVVPTNTFSQGFTVSVTQYSGGVSEKSTTKSITIERNHVSSMVPFEVEPLSGSVFTYTTSDERIISLTYPDFGGATIVSNEYEDGVGRIVFDKIVSTIGHTAFAGCKTLTGIVFPDSVTSIGDVAFDSCTSLTSITIPDSVTSIGDGAFYYCTSLINITIPDSVTSIGVYTFFECTSLTSITIPDSVTSIGDYAFAHCAGLTSITIPDSVTSIGDDAFAGCTSLTDITIPDSVTSIGDDAFFVCYSLTSITIPDSVTSIGSEAFMGCHSLINITIPDSVTSIGDYAFCDCTSLTYITIPDSVTSIGDYAFAGCKGLTSVVVLPKIPPSLGMDSFDDTNDCPIYVRAGSIDDYKSADFWSDYADRILANVTPQAIDLGLPSGLKWASFNLGASAPEEYGDYFAWGETEPYYTSQNPLVWKEGKESGYSWFSYKWWKVGTMTKYCNKSSYGYNGFTDTKTVLDLEDDAAHVSLGGEWRMPTDAEWTELRENCTWTWAMQNGVNGYQVTASNGNSIFLPAAGDRRDIDLTEVGVFAIYWSSSLDTDNPSYARRVDFYSVDVSRSSGYRCDGFSIRPVCD